MTPATSHKTSGLRRTGPSSVLLQLLVATACSAAASSSASSYTLARVHQGSSFFDGWEWYGGSDNLTQGSVNFVTQAASSDIAYLNSANNAIIKVDNTTTLSAGENRNSVRLQSYEAYDQGSLLIFDALHVPYGCSVWPAWWTVESDTGWPIGGEIDIMEQINGATVNQMALHTLTGCMADGTSATQTGDLTYTNCSTEANYDTGCTVVESNKASYGAAFAAAGGGVWATEFGSSGISMWFWSRADVPADIQVNDTSIVPDPSGWGLPTAFYSNDVCAWDDFFGPQRATIDVTLCGAWAGVAATFAETCTGTCTDLVMDPSNYDTAYFEIVGITMWCAAGTNCASTSPDLAALEGTQTSTSTTSAAATETASASPTATAQTSNAQIVAPQLVMLALVGFTWRYLSGNDF